MDEFEILSPHLGHMSGVPDATDLSKSSEDIHCLLFGHEGVSQDRKGKDALQFLSGSEADEVHNELGGVAACTRHHGLSDPSSTNFDDIRSPATEIDARSVEKHRIITGPFDYLRAIPGKNIRGQMIGAFNIWLEVPPTSLEIIMSVVDMLHTASLLVDDIEDGSSIRRGLPAAHHIFGTPQTINSANYVYFRALQEVQKLANQEAVGVFTDELLELHLGQGMDLFWRDTLTCPSESEYLDMVEKKTGGLFRLAVRLMQRESRKDDVPDCMTLVDTFGVLFQIRDDYQNLTDQTYRDSKGMCEDLTEGKFSFPIIHSLRQDPTNMQLLHILKMKPMDLEVKRYAAKHLENTGSLEYTRQTIRRLICHARHLSDALGKQNEQVHALLDMLAL